MRKATQQHVSRRVGAGRPKKHTAMSTVITPEQIRHETLEHNRLCGDLTELTKHAQSMVARPNSNTQCAICGRVAYYECTKCGKYMHQPWGKFGDMCFFDGHNTLFFGLAKCDTKAIGKRKSDWHPPSPSQRQRHATHIMGVLDKKDKETNDGDDDNTSNNSSFSL